MLFKKVNLFNDSSAFSRHFHFHLIIKIKLTTPKQKIQTTKLQNAYTHTTIHILKSFFLLNNALRYIQLILFDNGFWYLAPKNGKSKLSMKMS